jgi:hypothetical protein
MKHKLLIAAVALFLLGWTSWLVLDGRTGWTSTRTPVPMVDDITGIEYTEYRDEFRPGIEIPGATTLAAAGLALLSLFFKRRRKL